MVLDRTATLKPSTGVFRNHHFLFVPLAAIAAGLCACVPMRQKELTSPATITAESSVLLPKSNLLAPFRFSESQVRRFSTEFTLTNNGRVLKIEAMPNLGREGAQTMLDNGIMGVQALYANALSPYPGDISREVVSDARFRPQLVRTNWNGQPRDYVLLFANERFGYGATTADAARFRSLMGWFYCEREDVFYKVRCYFPLAARKEELEMFFLSLTCR